MTTSLHGVQQTSDGIHTILGLGPYADAATRIAAAGFVSTDLGKCARQTDKDSVHCLVGIAPIKWRRIGGAMDITAVAGTTYTLLISDADRLVQAQNAGATSITIPPAASVAFQVGDIVLFEQHGAGLLTLVAGGGVTLRRRGGSLVSNGQYAVISAIYLGSDTWLITGDTV